MRMAGQMNQFENIPVTLALTIGTIAVSVAVAFAITRSSAERSEKRIDALEGRADKADKNLSDFMLDANRRFVTDEMLTKLEERVVAAIDRLGDRLDRLFEARPPK